MPDNRPAKFKGYASPNYTPVPDELFDEQLPDLSGAELKVLLYIIRRTFGFKKDSDNISLSQMLHGITTRDGRRQDRGAGLSKKTLLGALRSLEDQNIIFTERRQSPEKGNEPTTYRLNVLNGRTVEETTPPLGEKLPQGGGGETTPSPRGRNSPIQETERQQTDISDSKLRMVAPSVRSERTGNAKPAPRRSGSTQMEAIGTTLSRRTRRATPAYDEDREVILAYISDFSREFSDRAPLKSSTTRALNLYRQSGLSREAFIAALYQARVVTKERTAAIRGAGEEGTASGPKNKMAYYFSVLEDVLGLKNDPASSPQHTE
jgi:hypothetical protein